MLGIVLCGVDGVEERLLAKLREFSECELDDDERMVLAVLLAPGVEIGVDLDIVRSGEVEGFASAAATDEQRHLEQHWLSMLLRRSEDLTDGW